MIRITFAAFFNLMLFTQMVKAQKINKDEIMNAMNKAADDWNKGDLDQYMSLYSPEATMMMPTGRVGIDSIRALYVKYYFNGKMPKQDLAYNNYELTMLGKKYALLTGRFILKAKGTLKERTGIFSLIFVHSKQGGWKLLHDHSG